jgi:hypothetical protein
MTAAGRTTKGTRAMARVLLRGGGALLCALGLAVMAQGLAVPVKARVAQVLLDRAFAEPGRGTSGQAVALGGHDAGGAAHAASAGRERRGALGRIGTGAGVRADRGAEPARRWRR